MALPVYADVRPPRGLRFVRRHRRAVRRVAFAAALATEAAVVWLLF